MLSTRRVSWWLGLTLGLGSASIACNKQQPPEPQQRATEAHALPFIEDDYPRALAQARQRKLPLFVDVWASWCHTCLSLKQYVLPDPKLLQKADQLVWLSIDSERASNAAFLQQFPGRSLPTLWVIDSATETPLLKWIGAATAAELALLLDEVRNAAKDPSGGAQAEASALWLRGNHATASGNAKEAIALYEQALKTGPAAWPMRARTVEALSMRYVETSAPAAAFELAQREVELLLPSTALVNVVVNGIDSGLEPDSHASPEALDKLVQRGLRIARDTTPSALVDDRSTLYLSVVTALSKTKPAEAASAARAWLALLDAAAARAKGPHARRVWDAHRVEAYIALNEADKAIPILQQSEREVPNDYNPPARLARAYLTAGKTAEAQAAIERALPLCDGPRKLRLYLLKSDILVAKEERAQARQALREALQFAEAKQLGPQYDKLRQSIERKSDLL